MKIQCKHCDDIIESKHVHDFVTCKCGKVSIDGGNEYARVLYPDGDANDHLIVVEETSHVRQRDDT